MALNKETELNIYIDLVNTFDINILHVYTKENNVYVHVHVFV